MDVIDLILLLLGAFCFTAAAFASRLEPYRLRLVAGGLLAWILVAVIDAVRALD